jgi:hypothetical protein
MFGRRLEEWGTTDGGVLAGDERAALRRVRFRVGAAGVIVAERGAGGAGRAVVAVAVRASPANWTCS